MKTHKTLQVLLAVPPLVFVSALLLFYVHGAVLLGRRPHYANPDPKAFDVYALYSFFIHVSFTAWLYTFIPWFILSVVASIRHYENGISTTLIAVLCIHCFAIMVLLSPILTWYAD